MFLLFLANHVSSDTFCVCNKLNEACLALCGSSTSYTIDQAINLINTAGHIISIATDISTTTSVMRSQSKYLTTIKSHDGDEKIINIDTEIQSTNIVLDDSISFGKYNIAYQNTDNLVKFKISKFPNISIDIKQTTNIPHIELELFVEPTVQFIQSAGGKSFSEFKFSGSYDRVHLMLPADKDFSLNTLPSKIGIVTFGSLASYDQNKDSYSDKCEKIIPGISIPGECATLTAVSTGFKVSESRTLTGNDISDKIITIFPTTEDDSLNFAFEAIQSGWTIQTCKLSNLVFDNSWISCTNADQLKFNEIWFDYKKLNLAGEVPLLDYQNDEYSFGSKCHLTGCICSSLEDINCYNTDVCGNYSKAFIWDNLPTYIDHVSALIVRNEDLKLSNVNNDAKYTLKYHDGYECLIISNSRNIYLADGTINFTNAMINTDNGIKFGSTGNIVYIELVEAITEEKIPYIEFDIGTYSDGKYYFTSKTNAVYPKTDISKFKIFSSDKEKKSFTINIQASNVPIGQVFGRTTLKVNEGYSYTQLEQNLILSDYELDYVHIDTIEYYNGYITINRNDKIENSLINIIARNDGNITISTHTDSNILSCLIDFRSVEAVIFDNSFSNYNLNIIEQQNIRLRFSDPNSILTHVPELGHIPYITAIGTFIRLDDTVCLNFADQTEFSNYAFDSSKYYNISYKSEDLPLRTIFSTIKDQHMYFTSKTGLHINDRTFENITIYDHTIEIDKTIIHGDNFSFADDSFSDSTLTIYVDPITKNDIPNCTFYFAKLYGGTSEYNVITDTEHDYPVFNWDKLKFYCDESGSTAIRLKLFRDNENIPVHVSKGISAGNHKFIIEAVGEQMLSKVPDFYPNSFNNIEITLDTVDEIYSNGYQFWMIVNGNKYDFRDGKFWETDKIKVNILEQTSFDKPVKFGKGSSSNADLTINFGEKEAYILLTSAVTKASTLVFETTKINLINPNNYDYPGITGTIAKYPESCLTMKVCSLECDNGITVSQLAEEIKKLNLDSSKCLDLNIENVEDNISIDYSIIEGSNINIVGSIQFIINIDSNKSTEFGASSQYMTFVRTDKTTSIKHTNIIVETDIECLPINIANQVSNLKGLYGPFDVSIGNPSCLPSSIENIKYITVVYSYRDQNNFGIPFDESFITIENSQLYYSSAEKIIIIDNLISYYGYTGIIKISSKMTARNIVIVYPDGLVLPTSHASNKLEFNIIGSGTAEELYESNPLFEIDIKKGDRPGEVYFPSGFPGLGLPFVKFIGTDLQWDVDLYKNNKYIVCTNPDREFCIERTKKDFSPSQVLSIDEFYARKPSYGGTLATYITGTSPEHPFSLKVRKTDQFTIDCRYAYKDEHVYFATEGLLFDKIALYSTMIEVYHISGKVTARYMKNFDNSQITAGISFVGVAEKATTLEIYTSANTANSFIIRVPDEVTFKVKSSSNQPVTDEYIKFEALNTNVIPKVTFESFQGNGPFDPQSFPVSDLVLTAESLVIPSFNTIFNSLEIIDTDLDIDFIIGDQSFKINNSPIIKAKSLSCTTSGKQISFSVASSIPPTNIYLSGTKNSVVKFDSTFGSASNLNNLMIQHLYKNLNVILDGLDDVPAVNFDPSTGVLTNIFCVCVAECTSNECGSSPTTVENINQIIKESDEDTLLTIKLAKSTRESPFILIPEASSISLTISSATSDDQYVSSTSSQLYMSKNGIAISQDTSPIGLSSKIKFISSPGNSLTITSSAIENENEIIPLLIDLSADTTITFSGADYPEITNPCFDFNGNYQVTLIPNVKNIPINSLSEVKITDISLISNLPTHSASITKVTVESSISSIAVGENELTLNSVQFPLQFASESIITTISTSLTISTSITTIKAFTINLPADATLAAEGWDTVSSTESNKIKINNAGVLRVTGQIIPNFNYQTPNNVKIALACICDDSCETLCLGFWTNAILSKNNIPTLLKNGNTEFTLILTQTTEQAKLPITDLTSYSGKTITFKAVNSNKQFVSITSSSVTIQNNCFSVSSCLFNLEDNVEGSIAVTNSIEVISTNGIETMPHLSFDVSGSICSIIFSGANYKADLADLKFNTEHEKYIKIIPTLSVANVPIAFTSNLFVNLSITNLNLLTIFQQQYNKVTYTGAAQKLEYGESSILVNDIQVRSNNDVIVDLFLETSDIKILATYTSSSLTLFGESRCTLTSAEVTVRFDGEWSQETDGIEMVNNGIVNVVTDLLKIPIQFSDPTKVKFNVYCIADSDRSQCNGYQDSNILTTSEFETMLGTTSETKFTIVLGDTSEDSVISYSSIIDKEITLKKNGKFGFNGEITDINIYENHEIKINDKGIIYVDGQEIVIINEGDAGVGTTTHVRENIPKIKFIGIQNVQYAFFAAYPIEETEENKFSFGNDTVTLTIRNINIPIVQPKSVVINDIDTYTKIKKFANKYETFKIIQELRTIMLNENDIVFGEVSIPSSISNKIIVPLNSYEFNLEASSLTIIDNIEVTTTVSSTINIRKSFIGVTNANKLTITHSEPITVNYADEFTEKLPFNYNPANDVTENLRPSPDSYCVCEGATCSEICDGAELIAFESVNEVILMNAKDSLTLIIGGTTNDRKPMFNEESLIGKKLNFQAREKNMIQIEFTTNLEGKEWTFINVDVTLILPKIKAVSDLKFESLSLISSVMSANDGGKISLSSKSLTTDVESIPSSSFESIRADSIVLQSNEINKITVGSTSMKVSSNAGDTTTITSQSFTVNTEQDKSIPIIISLEDDENPVKSELNINLKNPDSSKIIFDDSWNGINESNINLETQSKETTIASTSDSVPNLNVEGNKDGIINKPNEILPNQEGNNPPTDPAISQKTIIIIAVVCAVVVIVVIVIVVVCVIRKKGHEKSSSSSSVTSI